MNTRNPEAAPQSCLQVLTSSTFGLLKTFSVPATTFAVAGLMHSGVQVARQLDASTTKDTLKHYFALGASSTGVGGMSYVYLDFIQALIASNALKYLGPKQFLSVIATSLIGIGGTAFACKVFGVEEHILWSAISAATSETAIIAAKNMALFFAWKNQRQGECEYNPTPEELERLAGLEAGTSPPNPRNNN